MEECKHQLISRYNDPFDDKGNPIPLTYNVYCSKCGKNAEELGYKIANYKERNSLYE